jgi:hypothetical protein
MMMCLGIFGMCVLVLIYVAWIELFLGGFK